MNPCWYLKGCGWLAEIEMKWLFVLLLAANIIYFGWELDRETRLQIRNNPPEVSIPVTARQLQLISELEVPPSLREVPKMETIAAVTHDADGTTDEAEQLVAELPDIQVTALEGILEPVSCYRYGPVPDEELIRGLHDWFRSRNAIAAMYDTEEPAANMFWVYLAPQESRENAMALLEEMRSKGIGDYRLINRGDMVNAISLGLFSSREAVDARLAELQEKGFVPVVVPYADVRRMYWLDVQLPAASVATEEMFDGYPSRFTSVPVACAGLSGMGNSPSNLY
jgi:hypothetical protein